MDLEKYKYVQAITPQAGGAITGEYVDLKNVEMAWIVIQSSGSHASTMACTPYRATGDGAGAVVLANVVQISANLDTTTSDTEVKRTAALDYTLDAGVAPKVLRFQIDPASLGGDYDWLNIRTGASNALNITSAIFILKMKYAQETPPSVI